MAARLHPGAVRHVWDHFVLGLRGPDGDARLSLYAIGWSASLGGGTVALLDLPDGSARAWSDRPGLGEAMQARLPDIGARSASVTAPVSGARFERAPATSRELAWRIIGPSGGLEARWRLTGDPVWAVGPAPAFWAREDIWACFLEASEASIDLDGAPINGEPWLDDAWLPKLGRPLWSAHVALAEVRTEPAHETMAP